MEKENFDAKEYLNRCKIKPFWVNDRDDAMKYAAHLAHRLYQEKAAEAILWNELVRLHPEITDRLEKEILNKREFLDQIFFSDENRTNFTNWNTPTISEEKMKEMFPEIAKSVL